MPDFEVIGYGKDTGRKRKRRYQARDENEAIELASKDGNTVEMVTLIPEPPASEPQVKYARDLGLPFPENINMTEMSELLSRHLSEDQPCPQWLFTYADRPLRVHDIRRQEGDVCEGDTEVERDQ